MTKRNNTDYITAAMFIVGGLASIIAGYIFPIGGSIDFLLLVILGITLLIKFPSMMQVAVFVLLMISELSGTLYGLVDLIRSTSGILRIAVSIITAALYAYLAFACLRLSHETPVRLVGAIPWFLPVAVLAAVTVVFEAVDIVRVIEYVEWYYETGYLDSDAYFDKTEAIVTGAVWAVRTVLSLLGMLLVCLRLRKFQDRLEADNQ